ncbi:MAG: hypothetical protein AAFV62_07085 [Pseudomonadota bacterium]
MGIRLASVVTVGALLVGTPIPGMGEGGMSTAFAQSPELSPSPSRDPRADDPSFQRAQKLFGILREILDEAARERLDRQLDPDHPVEDFFKSSVGIDQNSRISELLGSAFEMMTDTPVTELQDKIERSRGAIERMENQIAELKERRISAPENGGWDSWLGLADDRKGIDGAVEELEERITAQEKRIENTKKAFADAMAAAGAPLPPDQIDLLLDSVTGSDLVELAAAYEAVRGISEQLRELMDQNGENLSYARRYYGMHTALIALLAEAQSQFLAEIDQSYLPKLKAIEEDIEAASRQTKALLKDDPTRAQRRALEANQESQRIAMEALDLYRAYLGTQRKTVRDAHRRTVKELRVADNTLRTVDASFQLRQLMESSALSFEALQSLESPGFDRVFKNEELRREFRELTDKLAPTS